MHDPWRPCPVRGLKNHHRSTPLAQARSPSILLFRSSSIIVQTIWVFRSILYFAFYQLDISPCPYLPKHWCPKYFHDFFNNHGWLLDQLLISFYNKPLSLKTWMYYGVSTYAVPKPWYPSWISSFNIHGWISIFIIFYNSVNKTQIQQHNNYWYWVLIMKHQLFNNLRLSQ